MNAYPENPSPTMTLTQMPSRFKAGLSVAVAGLASSIFGLCVISVTLLVAGVWFGAATAIVLKRCRIFSSQQAGRFVVVSILAYLVSFALTLKLASVFPGNISRPNSDHQALTVIVAAGALGGFLLIGGALWLLRPPLGGGATAIGALSGSAWGAALAGAGSVLGPSLGAIASALPGLLLWKVPEYQDWYSIFIVWQTGMGLMLGLILGGPQGPARARGDCK